LVNFILKEKIACEKIKKSRPVCRQGRENFSVLVPPYPTAGGGGKHLPVARQGNAPIYSGFCSKKVRISFNIHRQFTISAYNSVFVTKHRKNCSII